MGYWDAHGFSNFYTGPTAGGTAPINNSGTNSGIKSLWASEAGVDGRSSTNYGHVDDYWIGYQNEDPDPWHQRGYEHPADCIGDFMGLNQNRWTNMNGECNGNRDGWAFNYFDTSTGARRINFTPGPEAGSPPRDIQSGLRAYADYCGYGAQVFSQLADIWTDTPSGTGFTFQDICREIDAGYPLLLMLQDHVYSNSSGFNPDIHGLVICGYYISNGVQKVRVRTGWTTDPSSYDLKPWADEKWYGWFGSWPRGVIGFHPRPKVREMSLSGNTLHVAWDGPQARLYDAVADSTRTLHWYVVQFAQSLTSSAFEVISPATCRLSLNVSNFTHDSGFIRVRHLEEVQIPDTNLAGAVHDALTNKYGPDDVFFDLDMEEIQELDARNTNIVSLDGLEYSLNLTNLLLDDNLITQLDALVINSDADGLNDGDRLSLSNNPLNSYAQTNQIPHLTNNGVAVYW